MTSRAKHGYKGLGTMFLVESRVERVLSSEKISYNAVPIHVGDIDKFLVVAESTSVSTGYA